MKYFALLLLVFATFAEASDFTSRVKAGQLVLATTSGKSYEASWGDAMEASIKSCAQVGSTSSANLGKFIFVANISSSGLVSDVEVRPITTVSQCFAKPFGGTRLPRPPGASHGNYITVADSIDIRP
jgi:hypothetical protein